MTLERLDLPQWINGGGLRGDGFETYVSPAHGGPCAVGYNDRRGRHWVLFPSVPSLKWSYGIRR
jgi:hypothetical protein